MCENVHRENAEQPGEERARFLRGQRCSFGRQPSLALPMRRMRDWRDDRIACHASLTHHSERASIMPLAASGRYGRTIWATPASYPRWIALVLCGS